MVSPRCWNPGLLRYRDRLWLGYRYHRADTKDARCSIAICEIDDIGNPTSDSQRLELSDPTGTGHQEDCRFFLFRGEPYVSYTDMVGYQPNVDYTCVMKYARLKLTGKRWSVVEEWKPKYGDNTGFRKEKNWVFFEHANELFCVYKPDPEHIVLRMKDGVVMEEFKTKGPAWQWGTLRGGTSPVDLGDGRMLAILHSSAPVEESGEKKHYVRYYGAGYIFEKKPPFRVLEMAETPVVSGSEDHGHVPDPRNAKAWKPFVAFPGGLVRDGDKWLAAFGINDWSCAVGRFTTAQLKLGSPDGSSFRPRYFKVPNGTMAVKYIDSNYKPVFLHWTAIKSGRGCAAGCGYMKAVQPREAVEASEWPSVIEVTADEYASALKNVRS